MIDLNNLDTKSFRMQEAFKTLRTNISFCGDEIKTIAITSTYPHEGKSEVALRLAYAFAETGSTTLLLDADIRNSVLAGKLNAGEIKTGLSHLLSGKATEASAALYKTSEPNLDIMFTGAIAPNPAELLGSHRFETLLDKLKDQYDYVIIDCPPLSPVIDAALVAKACDGTLFVVAQNSTRKRDAKRALSQLRMSETKILGAVLNKVQEQGPGYGYGYGYGKYGKNSYGYGYGYGYSPKKNED